MTERRRSRRTAITIGAAAVLAAATGAAHVSNLPKAQLDALSGIDVPITATLIEEAFDVDPVDDLVALAHDAAEDAGVRLRAYRALSLYADAAPTLAADVDAAADQPPQTGTEVLLLRATIEAMGELGRRLGTATNWEVLIPHLSDSHRDIRAATADALRVMGATGAIDALYVRLNTETSEQVELAITRALRELNLLLP